MDRLFDDLRRRLDDHPEIVAAYLFGSVARGDASALSDVDVGVLLAEAVPNPLMYRARLAEELAGLGDGRPVEVVLLEESPPALASRITRDGRLLVCRDEERRVRFEIDVLQRDLDTVPLRRMYDRVRRESTRDGRFYG